jgi:hypothetical protein
LKATPNKLRYYHQKRQNVLFGVQAFLSVEALAKSEVCLDGFGFIDERAKSHGVR